MFVFHLIGSHFKYSNRYLEQYVLNKGADNIIREYENTVYFNDYDNSYPKYCTIQVYEVKAT